MVSGGNSGAVGSLRGVVLTNQKPAGGFLPVTMDPSVCGQRVPDETLLVQEGKLKNAVVFIEGLPHGSYHPTNAVLDQIQCRYVPHAQYISKGTKLLIKNSDPILHNAHSHDIEGRTNFNLALPLKNMVIPKVMQDVGPNRMFCDAGHSWTSAYVYVGRNPFGAVSDEKGQFHIEGIPVGTWTLKAWHEKLGEKKLTVTVSEKGNADLEIKF